jgi:MATE family multidrug resistance protein
MTQARPDGGWRHEAARIATLAWPVVLTNLNWTLMHLIDVVVVGLAGTHELSALGAARAASFVIIVFALGAMTGVLVFASRADGAGDRPQTGELLRQGLVMATLAGLALGLVALIAGPHLLRLTGVAPGLIEPGGAVLRAMALGYPGQMLLIATGYFLEGISRPRQVMIVNLAMLPVNGLLAWMLTLGVGGLPALGAVGAALATSLTSVLGAGAMLVAAWRLPDAPERAIRRIDRASWWRAARAAPALARFGLVPGIGAALEVVGFSWLMVISTRMGDVTAAAFQTLLGVHNVGYALALGLGSAAGVRVGNAVGAGEAERARSRTMIACGLSLIVMGTLVTLYLLFPGPIVAALAADPAVAGATVTMLTILAPFILLDGLQAILMSALRSLGDQVAAGINGIIGFFLLMGVAGWAAWRADMGAAGLAWAAGLGMTCAAALQALRFYRTTSRYQ